MRKITAPLFAAASLALCWSLAAAQQPTYKYSTPTPPGVAFPDASETRLGTLRFTDGYPSDATAQTLFDNLDFQRAVQAYLLALPAVSQAANRNAISSWARPTHGADLREHHGFTVDVPHRNTIRPTAGFGLTCEWALGARGSRRRCSAPSTTCGIAGSSTSASPGRTRAQGGKYLFLPPGYEGKVPEGYYRRAAPTFSLGRPGGASWSTATRSRASIW